MANNKTIHKIKKWDGIFWVPVCGGRMGSNPNRVTDDESKVTCNKYQEVLK